MKQALPTKMKRQKVRLTPVQKELRRLFRQVILATVLLALISFIAWFGWLMK